MQELRKLIGVCRSRDEQTASRAVVGAANDELD